MNLVRSISEDVYHNRHQTALIFVPKITNFELIEISITEKKNINVGLRDGNLRATLTSKERSKKKVNNFSNPVCNRKPPFVYNVHTLEFWGFAKPNIEFY